MAVFSDESPPLHQDQTGLQALPLLMSKGINSSAKSYTRARTHTPHCCSVPTQKCSAPSSLSPEKSRDTFLLINFLLLKNIILKISPDF